MFTVELSVHFVTAGSGWNVATSHAVLGVAVGSIRVQEPSTFLYAAWRLDKPGHACDILRRQARAWLAVDTQLDQPRARRGQKGRAARLQRQRRHCHCPFLRCSSEADGCAGGQAGAAGELGLLYGDGAGRGACYHSELRLGLDAEEPLAGAVAADILTEAKARSQAALGTIRQR